MSDRKEKVIKGLGRLSEWLFQQYQIVYDGDAPNYYDAYKTVDDAIDLLKEQKKLEPEKVFHMKDRSIITETHGKTGFCPRCNQVVIWEINRRYCGFCGKGLIWDGD